MKKFILSLLIFLAVPVAVLANDSNRDNVVRFTELVDDQLPLSINDAITLKTTEIVNDTVRNEVVVEGFEKVKPAIAANQFDMSDFIITQLNVIAHDDYDANTWLSMIADAELYFRMVIVDENGKAIYDFMLSPDQMQEILNSEPNYEKAKKYNSLISGGA